MAADQAQTKRKPYMKMYWTDWRADPALRMCSYAARGLWADIISLMHEAEPYGHLTIKGKAPTPKQLAGLLGGSEAEVRKLLAELKTNEVCGVGSDGVLFSRRMLRDREKEARDRANGLTGGNPKLAPGDNPPDTPKPPDGKPPPLTSGITPGDKAHGISHSQKPKPEAASATTAELPLDRLARLLGIDLAKLRQNDRWLGFPGALYEWKQQGCDVDRDVWPTIERLATRGRSISSPAYFTDAILRARDDRIAAEPSELERWATRVEAFKLEGFWPDAPPPQGYGPKPGQPGCLCPPELLIGVAA